MFSKLMKHEFLATWKVMVTLEAVLAAIGVVGFLVIFGMIRTINNDDYYNTTALSFTLMTLLMIILFGIIAVLIISIIYLIIRYYRSLYTPEGYLTFTLPASTVEILSAKILTGIFWSAVTTTLIMVDAWMMITGYAFANTAVPDILSITSDFNSIFTVDGITIAPLIVVLYYVKAITGILAFYVSITIGQLWAKHKILGAVLCWITIRIVTSIISSLIQMISGAAGNNGFFGFLFFRGDFARYYQASLIQSLVFTLILGTMYYLGCIFITKQRVNLD